MRTSCPLRVMPAGRAATGRSGGGATTALNADATRWENLGDWSEATLYADALSVSLDDLQEQIDGATDAARAMIAGDDEVTAPPIVLAGLTTLRDGAGDPNRMTQLFYQAEGAVVSIVYAAIGTLVLVVAVDKTLGLRMTERLRNGWRSRF